MRSFIDELEKEARLPNSPIWDPFFRPFVASGKQEDRELLAASPCVFDQHKWADEIGGQTPLKIGEDDDPEMPQRRRSSVCYLIFIVKLLLLNIKTKVIDVNH